MKNKHYGSLLLLLLPLWFASVVMADETEIYFTDNSGEVTPNVLFLIDASGSMAQTVAVDGVSRMQVLKDSFRTVMTSAASSNLNVGLMHYANHGLGADYWWSSIKGVNFPVSPIGEKVQPLIAPHKNTDNLPNPATGNTKVHEFLADIVTSWDANGYTPIVDSLYEAARYYRGDAVGWGNGSAGLGWAAHPLTYNDVTINCTQYQTASGVSSATPPVSPDNPTCVKEWGQCNGEVLENTCVPISYSACCNWVQPSGNEAGYCAGNNFSCLATITTCENRVCTNYDTSVAPTYQSPIKYSCQANYLVLMSDGKPEYPYYPGAGEVDGTHYYPPSSVRYPGAGVAADKSGEIKVSQRLENYMGVASCTDGAAMNDPAGNAIGYNSGVCGPELTEWLATTDQDGNASNGKQVVKTYTVGFALNAAASDKGEEYLQLLAEKGQGKYFPTGNEAELTGAFRSILNDIEKNGRSFTSPTYTVDPSSLLSHGDEVFVPMFDRDTKIRWPGNLKKFKLALKDNDDTGIKKGELYGKNGKVLNEKGEFLVDAYDFWGAAASGKEVASGGAASKLPAPAARKLYTDISGAQTPDLLSIDTVTLPLLGITGASSCTDNAECKKLVDFMRGKNAGADPDPSPDTSLSVTAAASKNYERVRQYMGDMLNTQPQVVTYETDSGRESYVFTPTNEGYLHAIDGDTGVEKWAFMPKSLLKNAKAFYENAVSETHVYGLDGGMSLWQYDANRDGKIRSGSGSSDDKIYLFFGMRRGGSEYYALDISDINNPKIAWRISNTGAGDFASLGQTWSKPARAKMRVAAPTTANPKQTNLMDVLVFGGGYDPALETNTTPANAKGADVFIVNAKTGDLIWRLNKTDLKHSIPGDIRVLDMDRNGALDRLYFSDTGGNVWRVDMDVDVSDADTTTMYDYSKARLSKFAELGGSGANNRMFFYEPDVALMQDKGKTILTLAIGSGYRSRPLDTSVEDRFYVLVDRNPYSAPASDIFPIKEDKLVSIMQADGVTDNSSVIGGNKTLLTETALNGWYYDLTHTGEKVLAPAVTFLNKVIFTTFAPVDATGAAASLDPCKVPPNSARAYVLNLFNGAPVADLDKNTPATKDRFVIAGTNEILAGAQIVFRAPMASGGGTCTEGDCKQTVEIRVGKMSVPLMDDANNNNANTGTGNGINDIANKTDLTDILPRMFWLDQNVAD